jgi:hypothetical protein
MKHAVAKILSPTNTKSKNTLLFYPKIISDKDNINISV